MQAYVLEVLWRGEGDEVLWQVEGVYSSKEIAEEDAEDFLFQGALKYAVTEFGVKEKVEA